MKRQKLWMSGIVLLVAALMAGLGAQGAKADQAIGYNNVQADLKFSVLIPQLLYLRVGTADSNVNTINFDFTNPPWLGGNSFEGTITSADTALIRIIAIVGSTQGVILTALPTVDFPAASGVLWSDITASTGDGIPWKASHKYVAGNNIVFDKAASGSGIYETTYNFSLYYNVETHTYTASSTAYQGTVTYTLSTQ